MPRFRPLLTSSFLYIACACAYQVSAPAESTPATVEATGNITLYVVANDKSGNPISGLHEQDFAVQENKQLQKIAAFRASSAANNDVSEIILILDAVNTSFTRVAYARDQIDRFLRQDAGRLQQEIGACFFPELVLCLEGDTKSELKRPGIADAVICL
jgi:hypothetical protein